MAENYIQKMFAERIGGDQFGKSNVIYKFEKIKRANRAPAISISLLVMRFGPESGLS